jgi:ribosomal protein L7/L12
MAKPMETAQPDPLFLALAKRLHDAGEGREVVLRDLRAAGASVIESLKVVRHIYGLSLEEAKPIVHLSDAWADLREAHDQLHRSIEEAVEGRSESPPV